MTLQQKLRTDIEEWNEPRRVKFGMPVGAAIGAVAGVGIEHVLGATVPYEWLAPAVGAALGVLLAWVVLAALD